MLLLRLFFFILHVISLLGNADKGAKNLPAFPIATISKRKRLNNVIRSESRKKIKKISQLTLSPAKPFFEHPIQSKTDGRVDHNKSDESNTGIMIECQHGDGCQKQATFGMFGRNMQPKPMFCLKHALHDNFFLKRGWCRWFFLFATTPQPYTSHIATVRPSGAEHAEFVQACRRMQQIADARILVFDSHVLYEAQIPALGAILYQLLRICLASLNLTMVVSGLSSSKPADMLAGRSFPSRL